MGDIARRASPEHLRSLESVGHRVERLGQFSRFAVVTAGRPGARIAGLESPGRGGHIVQGPSQAARDRCRKDDDPEHADQPGDRKRHVEQGQEASVAGARREVRLQGGHDRSVDLDRNLVVDSIAGGPSSECGERPAIRGDDPDLTAERVRKSYDDGLGAGRAGGSGETIGQDETRIVQPLLLLVGQDGLEAAAHHPVDHDADEQQDGDHGHAEQQPDAPCQRAPP